MFKTKTCSEKVRPGIITALCLMVLVLFAAIPVTAEEGPSVNAIEIQGNNRVNTDTILAKIKSRVGEPFSKETVQDDIKHLYGLGYFDDVSVDIDSFEGGVKLVFNIKEKPVISSIDFQGNKEYEAKDLKEKITLTSGAMANTQLIIDNAQKLTAYYHSEGYWLVKVQPIIREVSKDSAAVTFQIDEGPKVTISDIIIEGNKAVSKKEIKKAMKTKKRWLFSFLTNSGIYQREQMLQDIENIKAVYQNKGYLAAAVSEPELLLSPDRKKLSVKISVSEGDQYKVGELKFTGNKLFTSEELFKYLHLGKGQIFNKGALRNDIDGIVDLYMEKGYARADIEPLIDVDQQNKQVALNLAVKEGDIYRIGRIDIAGNTKTRDKVIRREIRLDEGDTFNKKLLKRSYQRINNLNFFETVDITPYPRPQEKLIDLDVKVKEKLTGMLSIGGGYSSVDKFMIMGEITQANLFGKGLYLRLKTELSANRKNYNLSLKDPWFMDKPLSASIGLYNDFYEYPDYDKKATGGTIGFGKELSEYVAGNITYDLEQVEITNLKKDASSLIRDQEGIKLTSSLSPSIWRDTRDNIMDPTTGYRYALYTTFAGLGGDNYFIKGRTDTIWYFPAKWGTTFSARGQVGYATGIAGEELPLYERFYVGGINTMRGLGFGEAGPRNKEGERIGGNLQVVFNGEYIFPLVEDIKLKGLVFFDYGSAFDKDETFTFDDFRKTAGFGFRWLSPLGPLRLEWGYNLDRKKKESDSKLEFSIGGIF